MTTLQFETDASGNRWLRDKHFDGVTFADLSLNTAAGSTLLLERLSLLHCKTDPGTCWIGGQTTLRDVVIEDLECGDAMRFDSNCRFECVVLRQKKPTGKLLITPVDADLPCGDDIDSWCLDITEFIGAEVVVVGLPADRVRINPDRHVIVHRNWRYQLDWALLGLNRLGFIGLTTKKVDVHARETGIFSLPDPKKNNHHYREAVAEIDLLRRAGIIIG
ncbi:MAG: hypothetical protein JNK90_14850 [Planctomycetaceae bacterium]|nr:hypothetical protein [Planctomycetaceae bacterium]